MDADDRMADASVHRTGQRGGMRQSTGSRPAATSASLAREKGLLPKKPLPADSGDELARRFAARAGAVDSQDGFEGFELLKPTDERTTWLVVTRWRDEASFQAWLSSPAFGHGHRSAAERSGGKPSAPVGVSSELWSYEIAGGSSG